MKLGYSTRKGSYTKSNDENHNRFVDTTSFSIETSNRQKMGHPRTKLGHARMTHIPRSMMKIIINFVDTSSFSTVTNSCKKT